MKCELCSQRVPQKARNYQHHKKLFVLFNIAYENWDQEANKYNTTRDQFRTMVLIEAGYSHVYCDFNGNTRVDAQSISYAKMGQARFDKCFSDCLKVIADIVLKCGRDELHDEIMTRF